MSKRHIRRISRRGGRLRSSAMKIFSRFAKFATSWNSAISTARLRCWSCWTPIPRYARQPPPITRHAPITNSACGNSIRRSGEICNERKTDFKQAFQNEVANEGIAIGSEDYLDALVGGDIRGLQQITRPEWE